MNNKAKLVTFANEKPDSIEDALVFAYVIHCQMTKHISIASNKVVVLANEILRKFQMKTTVEQRFKLKSHIANGESILRLNDTQTHLIFD